MAHDAAAARQGLVADRAADPREVEGIAGPVGRQVDGWMGGAPAEDVNVDECGTGRLSVAVSRASTSPSVRLSSPSKSVMKAMCRFGIR